MGDIEPCLPNYSMGSARRAVWWCYANLTDFEQNTGRFFCQSVIADYPFQENKMLYGQQHSTIEVIHIYTHCVLQNYR